MNVCVCVRVSHSVIDARAKVAFKLPAVNAGNNLL
jgi:hypothetical protein